jgi:hypothetical protein
MRVICTGKNILSTNVLNQNNLIAYILVFDGDFLVETEPAVHSRLAAKLTSCSGCRRD